MENLQGGKNFSEWLFPQDFFKRKNSIFTQLFLI